MRNQSKRGNSDSWQPSAFEIRVASELRTLGMRVTGSRLSVARVLYESATALAAKDIHDLVVKSGHRTNLVSVYRILAILTELGLVHRIGAVDGFVACKLGEMHSNDTEHWVCSSCGDVTEVTMSKNIVDAARSHLLQKGFQPSAIRIEVEGECRRCQSPPQAK